MNNFFRFIRNITFPTKKDLDLAIKSLSKREWLAISALLVVFIVCTLMLLDRLNNRFLVEVPGSGGMLSEGIIGTPRFINPVLAVSDADRDLTSLVYSGLMKKTPDGGITPDLADHYDVSKDGLTYTFKLRDDIFFQDNTPVTAEDIVFTINEAKDPNIKSPKLVNWQGVDVQADGENTVQFHLKQPYATFLENATLGILPSHLWKNVPSDEFTFSDFNTQAIGSGPYKITAVKKTGGIPVYFELSAFHKYASGKPHISTIGIHVYGNENDLVNALEGGVVSQISAIDPDTADKLKQEGFSVKTSVLPRIFGLFFNQNQSHLFTDKNVIKAFGLAIDRGVIIQNVLHGYGVPIDSPIPVGMIKSSDSDANASAPSTSSLDAAKQILASDGWKAGPNGILQKNIPSTSKKKGSKGETLTLSFTLSTGDTPELSQAAELVKSDIEKLGAHVDLQVSSIGDLNQNVIRPRKYDALFFGQIVNHESDLFAFWHSSQIKDPGLNVALYASPKADKLLSDALSTLDEKTRQQDYAQFAVEVMQDSPALFVYSPEFIYVIDPKIRGMADDSITIPSDRFLGISNWYLETEKVWEIFVKK